jgi:hypothetical protein
MSQSQSKQATDGKDFVFSPLHNLVGVFHTEDSMNATIDELEKSGFERHDMRTFTGAAGIEDLDFDGSGNGSAAELLRSLQRLGPDRTYLDRYEKYLQDGDCILMLHVPEEEQKKLAADIIRKESVHRITYFGTFVIEEV